MATNKRERDSDAPISHASSESPQPTPQDDGPRTIAGSRRVNKDPSESGQSPHQPNPQQWNPPQLPTPSTSTSQLWLPSHNQQYPDHSMAPTLTYTLPIYSEELGRLPLHGQLSFSDQSYVDQENSWYRSVPNNGGSGSGIIEGNANSDHILSNASSSSSLSHHSNRSQQQPTRDHSHFSSSHNSPNNYAHSTIETSTIIQGYPLNSMMGSGNMIFDPMPLPYIPPTSYVGVSPSMDIVLSQNPVGTGGRSSHPNFQGVPVGVRNDLGSGSGGIVDQRPESSQPPPHLEQPHHQHHQRHTQGQREQDVHGNHHHCEQQQQKQQLMGYSYVDNDTMAMWSTAPTGFEYVFVFVKRGLLISNVTFNIGWMSGGRT